MPSNFLTYLKKGLFYIVLLSIAAGYASFYFKNDVGTALSMALVFSFLLLPCLFGSYQIFYKQHAANKSARMPKWFLAIILLVFIHATTQILTYPLGNIHLSSETGDSEINTITTLPEHITEHDKNNANQALSPPSDKPYSTTTSQTATSYSVGFSAENRMDLLKLVLPLLSVPLLMILLTVYSAKRYKGHQLSSWFIFMCGWSVLTGWIVAWIGQPGYYLIVFIIPLLIPTFKTRS